MKFIKELITKKTQSSTLTEEIDADLQELRAEPRADEAGNVPDFSDLVAEFNPESDEDLVAETGEDILAIFGENQNEMARDDDEEDDSTGAVEYYLEEVDDDDHDDDEYLADKNSASDLDQQVPETVVPLPLISQPTPAEIPESEYEEPKSEPAVAQSDNIAEPQVKKIWDIQDDEYDDADTGFEPEEEPIPPEPAIVAVPAPAAGRAGRRAGRVKTRLLGFEQSQGAGVDLFDPEQKAERSADAKFPVGWIVIIDGPGRGSSFSLFNGVSQIGRGEDQVIRLDFGDNSISRSNHAAVAYDSEQCAFFLGHGGKANLVRLNDKPVLSTEELADSDLIRIGETTLRFVALCGVDFDWERDAQEDGDDAAIA